MCRCGGCCGSGGGGAAVWGEGVVGCEVLVRVRVLRLVLVLQAGMAVGVGGEVGARRGEQEITRLVQPIYKKGCVRQESPIPTPTPTATDHPSAVTWVCFERSATGQAFPSSSSPVHTPSSQALKHQPTVASGAVLILLLLQLSLCE